jgi:60S ribosomal subunit assembly/export protein LOC1
MAPLKPKSGGSKGQSKKSSASSKGGSSKVKKSGPKPKPVQQKTKPTTAATKKKPPHLRFTEKELKVPALNGIRPAGVQKPPNAKKGKNFVDDKDQMNAILAMVMAEKEGNIESKMMKARQLAEVRESRRLEAEKRVEGKKEGLEERKREIKEGKGKKKRRVSNGDAATNDRSEEKPAKKSKKRVSFG